jgi:tetratricopeptide (TPR) repeat protein
MELDPYSEDGVRRLISLLDRTGNRADAIRTYDEFRDRMARELESEPSKETRALAESLREQPAVRRALKSRTHTAGETPVIATTATGMPSADSKLSWKWLAVPVVAIALVAAAALINYRATTKTASPVTNRVVIAEFASAVEDTALGRTITEALRLDLSRSNLIKVMSDATARDALVLMKRDTLLRITPELAREIAVRENIKAVLAGDVRRAANGFVLSVQLISPDGGDIINGWRVTARDSSQLLQAIDQLSSLVRQDAGESIRAIKSSSPLLRVSTTSLSALRKEAMGIDAFHDEDYRRAVTLIREAIAEDSTFTDAYMMLSAILFNSTVHPAHAIDAAIKAYQYRDKVRDAERYAVTFNYLWAVKGDIPAALDAEKNAADLDPVTVFWGRYAGLLMQVGRHREAELVALRGVQWEANPFVYVFLATARFRQGKIDEARRTISYGLRVYPSSPVLTQLRIDVAEATGDYMRADSMAHALPEAAPMQRANIDAILGKLDEAHDHLVELRRAQESSGSFYGVMPTWIALARLKLDLAHDTARAITIVDSIPSTAEWKALYPRERPYAMLAHFYVRAGKPQRARALLDDLERNVPEDYRAHDRWLARRARAMLRVAGGDASQVAELREIARTDPQPINALADIVWAYQRLGMSREAADAAKTYLNETNPRRIESDAFNLAPMRALVSGSQLRDSSQRGN